MWLIEGKMKREDVIYTLSCFGIKSYSEMRDMTDSELLNCIKFVESQIGKKLKIKTEK